MKTTQKFKPSAKNCADVECPHLETEDIVAGDRIRKRKICGLTGKIPGNQECPEED